MSQNAGQEKSHYQRYPRDTHGNLFCDYGKQVTVQESETTMFKLCVFKFTLRSSSHWDFLGSLARFGDGHLKRQSGLKRSLGWVLTP